MDLTEVFARLEQTILELLPDAQSVYLAAFVPRPVFDELHAQHPENYVVEELQDLGAVETLVWKSGVLEFHINFDAELPGEPVPQLGPAEWQA